MFSERGEEDFDGRSSESGESEGSWFGETPGPTGDDQLPLPDVEEPRTSPAAEKRDSSLSVFPGRSVNLVVAGSNSGKSFWLSRLLAKSARYFEEGYPTSVAYIRCNYRNSELKPENPFQGLEDKMPPVTCYNLSDIQKVEDILKPKMCVVLDDVTKVCEIVHFFVSFASNHLNLVTFILCQQCMGTDIFKLLYTVHSLTLFFNNSGAVSITNYLTSHFFLGQDKKRYLKEIFGEAASKKFILNLRLNNVASSGLAYNKILAFSNLAQLAHATRPYCKVFLERGEEDWVPDMNFGPEVSPDSFVLVRASDVRKPAEEDDQNGETCSKEKDWTKMQEDVTTEIKHIFQPNRWTAALSFFREVLRCKAFCISSDYRTLLIKGKQKVRASLIDLVALATRRSHPLEAAEKFAPFLPFVKLLLKNKIPRSLVKNQRLLELAEAKRGVLKRHGPGVAGRSRKARDNFSDFH